MSNPFDHSFVNPRLRGPYGTNVGDTWFMGDGIQQELANDPERGPHWRAIVYVQERNGKVQESYFVTENPEIIEEARQGTIKWAEAQARNN